MSRIIRVGARCHKLFTMKQEDVTLFGRLIQDDNPIHHKVEAARAAGFPSCVCYGMLVGSLFSGLMATEIPGPHTVYIRQNLRFTAPVFVGDTLRVAVEVHQFRRSKGLLALRTVIHKVKEEQEEEGILCVEGLAVGKNKNLLFEGESDWSVSL